MNWCSIKTVRQDALLQKMKMFTDEQIAADSDVELPTVYRSDVMGEDISDVPGLFRSGDFLRCGRELGGSLSGDIIWVGCVQCGPGLGGGLGGDIRESLQNFGHRDVAIFDIP